MKDTFIKNATQIFLIVFSVVLGLYLSERIEERKTRIEAQKLLSKIASEVSENKKLMDIWVPYHQEVIKNWDSIYSDETFMEKFYIDQSILYKTLFTKNTIIGRMPVNDAWEIAKSHPLMVDIDYDKLLILSKVYNQQENTFEPFPRILDLLREPDFNHKDKALTNLKSFKGLMVDLVALELQLMVYLNEAEEVLGV